MVVLKHLFKWICFAHCNAHPSLFRFRLSGSQATLIFFRGFTVHLFCTQVHKSPPHIACIHIAFCITRTHPAPKASPHCTCGTKHAQLLRPHSTTLPPSPFAHNIAFRHHLHRNTRLALFAPFHPNSNCATA